MKIHTYVVEHDLGFAPNPFLNTCTLACCKPDIRKYAKAGEIVLGTGSKRFGRQGYLVYFMYISQVLNFDQYWNDQRFKKKKPVMHGSAMQRYGDNIYHRDPSTGAFQWIDSFHSEPGGVLSTYNLNRDTGRTDRVLIGTDYSYWGGTGPKIPDALKDFVVKRQGWKCNFSQARVTAMLQWLSQFPMSGFMGEPTDWQDIEL